MVFQGDSIIDRLRETECPAFWKLETLENKEKSMYEKLCVKSEEIAGQPWRYVILEIAMSYECIKAYKVPQASQKLQDCLTSINNTDDNSFIKKYETAFRHLVQSFRAYVALEKQAHSEAKRCFNEIVGLTAMSKPDLAAVYGIKANVLSEYGVGGTEEAFVWTRKALELNDTEPEWHFLLGKLSARWRHFALIREPSEEEINCLEEAYKLNKAPHTAVYLAENCSERAKLLYHQLPLERGKRVHGPKTEIIIKNLNRRALQLFNQAKEMNEDQCVHIMIRCAHGFVMLPAEFKNPKLGFELAEKARKKAPENAMLRATLSQIYRTRGDVKGAIINASISASAGAFGSHIRLMNLYEDFKNKLGTEKDKEVDIVALITKTLELFPMDVYRLQLFIYGANYFLIVKRDLFRSLPYFEKAMELDTKFNLLKDRYVRWVRVYLNLFELMFNEIECAISKESFVNDKEKLALLRVREKIIAACPKVVDLKIERDLVNKLKENRFPFNRGRTRTRNKNNKDPKKRKTGHKNSQKRLKSAVSLSAHSIDAITAKMRSSSDDRAFHLSYGKNDHQKTSKRPLSLDGRSQSREENRKKQLKQLQQSLSDLTIDELKPDTSSKWATGSQSSLTKCLSQMSIDLETTGKNPQRKESNFFSKRSGSFDRQSQPQKKTTAVKLLDDKNVLSFMPSYSNSTSVSTDNSSKPKSPVQYGSLTVANVEKLGNSKIRESRESLDSDDTSNCPVSLPKTNIAKSVSDVSMTTKRSVSLDGSRSLVQEVGAKKSESLVGLCEPDNSLASEIDVGPLTKGKPQVVPQSSKLVNTGVKLRPGSSGLGLWAQEQTLSERLRDLSLEKRKTFHTQGSGEFSHGQRDARESTARPLSKGRTSHVDSRSSFGRQPSSDRNAFGDPRTSYGHRPSTERTYDDRRSPFGRHPSTEGRVLRPPGSRSHQRSDSESSVSSAGSDYVASQWTQRRRNY